MAYVMMGRVQQLKDLFIAGKFDEGKMRGNKKVLEESLRLEKIALSWKSIDISYLSIVSMNITSFPRHYKDYLVDYKVMKKEVICLQETWLLPQIRKNYLLNGFESCHASIGKGIYFLSLRHYLACRGMKPMMSFFPKVRLLFPETKGRTVV